MRIYAMILPRSVGREIGRIFEGVGKSLTEFTPELKSEVVLASVDMSAEEYIMASVASAVVLGFFMFAFTYLPLVMLELAPGIEFLLSIIPAVILMVLDFFILIRYPSILAVKRAEMLEKDLIYALKDMLLNISAGLSLFESIRKVSEGDYGYVSQDLKKVVEKTNRGMALDDALEELAISTSSEYMRNALWQTINAVKAGTSVKEALTGIIDSLLREQNRKIRNYIQELNVLTLMYMLFAVAVPTIITTVLVVLTSLMGTGVNEDTYVLVIAVCLLIQVGLVGFIKSRRPLVYG